jgi:hypothetical protein
MTNSVGKRQRERQKLEQAQAKAERRAARRAAGAEPPVGGSHRSEAELIEDLAALHRVLEAGEVSPEEFEERRSHIQAQLERLA